MNPISRIIFCLLLLSTASCQNSDNGYHVLFGADVLIKENLHLIENKRIGLVLNQTSLLKNGTSLLDSLIKLGLNVTTIFSPEHGFTGKRAAGEIINDSTYLSAGIKIYSLFGNEKKPTTEMLKYVDILLFDLQDIGTRFYTYISTLYYVIEASAENKIQLIVLDRPNPLGGIKIEGPILNKNFKSFIGISEIPVVHGMTVGELANYFIDEIINSEKEVNINIIKMENWKREYDWDQLERNWIPTSPNIPDFETALIYPGTCLLEGTNISEGRGTENPFKIIGAPFINSDEVIVELKKQNINRIELTPVTFTPENIPGKASKPKFENEICYGIKINIIDQENFIPVQFGIKLICTLQKLYPSNFKFNNDHFDKLIGNDNVRKMVNDGTQPESIINSWQKALSQFKEKRKQYLLY